MQRLRHHGLDTLAPLRGIEAGLGYQRGLNALTEVSHIKLAIETGSEEWLVRVERVGHKAVADRVQRGLAGAWESA